MKVFRCTVMFAVILLACAGVYSAVRNLPVLSGCNFYGECPQEAAGSELPTVAMEASSEPAAP
jgi:hypothetical protein